ncbi:hypothetical protein BDM02DRAFT_1251659 [Thelephora ganbajun]|uniref:Uncharacterized protein n=1 Tax=Thelephora ganbajun TaxID=370292 RepID=A0ACB6ZMZ1_THEGA|nr:hypothetical protein BDM02DRAFT_1251659 [Thelephora ganbajun]
MTKSMSDPNTSPQPPLSQESPPIYRYRAKPFKDQQERFAYDIERKVLGPMPTEELLKEFFPLSCDLQIDFRKYRSNPHEIDFASVPLTEQGGNVDDKSGPRGCSEMPISEINHRARKVLSLCLILPMKRRLTPIHIRYKK